MKWLLVSLFSLKLIQIFIMWILWFTQNLLNFYSGFENVEELEKHVMDERSQKSDGWKITTSHASPFTRGTVRASKRSIDSGLGSSFRKSTRKAKAKAAQQQNKKHSSDAGEDLVAGDNAHLSNRAVSNVRTCDTHWNLSYNQEPRCMVYFSSDILGISCHLLCQLCYHDQ